MAVPPEFADVFWGEACHRFIFASTVGINFAAYAGAVFAGTAPSPFGGGA